MRSDKESRRHAERETLRRKGQFWTPDWVADYMVSFAFADGAGEIFDPSVGEGAFFHAAKRMASRLGRPIRLSGTEVDASTIRTAQENGLSVQDLSDVEMRDFLSSTTLRRYPAIVANPPYIRHHRLSVQTKTMLRKLAVDTVGAPLDGRTGYHVFFLIRALALLEPNGRLVFIVPSDTCEGVFAPTLWRWIARHYRIEVVTTFSPDATPFPGVDVNAVILTIRNAEPLPEFVWLRCEARETDALIAWALSDTSEPPVISNISSTKVTLADAIRVGLTRVGVSRSANGIELRHFARVMRGIATGANQFFLLTHSQVREHRLPLEATVRVIARTRDVSGDIIDGATLQALDERGRPTYLLSADGRSLEFLDANVREYLLSGERLGIHKQTLIATRNPWYKMETRSVPSFLFAYLGRRNARFIRNCAGVVPLTGFLCVYPVDESPEAKERLWSVLSHPETVKNLRLVGKSYGGGAIKVEPRALERLPLPARVVEEYGLPPHDARLF